MAVKSRFCTAVIFSVNLHAFTIDSSHIRKVCKINYFFNSFHGILLQKEFPQFHAMPRYSGIPKYRMKLFLAKFDKRNREIDVRLDLVEGTFFRKNDKVHIKLFVMIAIIC